jgi:hypothetical protein
MLRVNLNRFHISKMDGWMDYLQLLYIEFIANYFVGEEE